MGTVAAIERGYRADAGPGARADAAQPVDRDARPSARLLPGPWPLRPRRGQPGSLGATAAASTRSSAPSRCSRSLGELSGALAGARGQAPSAARQRRSAQPTIVGGGAFISNVPEAVTVHLNATYLPGERGRGRLRQRRRAPRSSTPSRPAAAGTPGCASNPVRWTWATDYPPSEIDSRRGDRGHRRATSRSRSGSRERSRGSTRPTTARC